MTAIPAEVWTVSFKLSASVVIMSGRRELMGIRDQRSPGDRRAEESRGEQRRRDQARKLETTHLENINYSAITDTHRHNIIFKEASVWVKPS